MASDDPTVKLFCSFGGKILRQSGNSDLRYSGGHTHILSLRRSATLADLLSKIGQIVPGPVTVKYQLPVEDLDALISITTNEDLNNMMEEFDRFAAATGPDGSARIRIFLFSQADVDSSGEAVAGTGHTYVDPINGIGLLRRRDSLVSASSNEGMSPLPSHGSINQDLARLGLGLLGNETLAPTSSRAIEPLPLPQQQQAQYFNPLLNVVNVVNLPVAPSQFSPHHENENERAVHPNVEVMDNLNVCSFQKGGFRRGGTIVIATIYPNNEGVGIISDSRTSREKKDCLVYNDKCHLKIAQLVVGRVAAGFCGNVQHGVYVMNKLKEQIVLLPQEEQTMDRIIDLANKILKTKKRKLYYFDIDLLICSSDRDVVCRLSADTIVYGSTLAIGSGSNFTGSLLSQDWDKGFKVERVNNYLRGVVEFVKKLDVFCGGPSNLISILKNGYFSRYRDYVLVADSRNYLLGVVGNVNASSDSLFCNQDPQKFIGNMAPPRINKVPSKEFGAPKDVSTGNHSVNTKGSDVAVLAEESGFSANMDLPVRFIQGEDHSKQEVQGSAEQVVAPAVQPFITPAPITFPKERTKADLPSSRESGYDETIIIVQSTTAIADHKIEGVTTKQADNMNFGFRIKDDIGHPQIIMNSDLEELRELSSGTFGTVYHGKWKGSDVAIKRINNRYFAGKPSEEQQMKEDFLNEACKLADMHHPNVVAFYGVVLDGPGGTVATLTEFMVNGSLRRALQKNDKSLDRRKRLLIAMDVAFGMEYLHVKNIIHFDLKSDNLLVNLRDPQRPICKVADLGLSKVKCQTLISGGVRGTLPWMAPELLNGGSTLVSDKVDVFSFGIVMWELLTGEEPYADLHYGAIIGGIVSNTLRPPVPESCDPEWRSLMEQCWSPEPSQRPNFTEIASRLRSMAASYPQK